MTRRLLVVGAVALVALVVRAGTVWWWQRSREPVDPGCDGTPDGPSALVGFELDDGAHRWDATVGRVVGAAAIGDLIVTRAEAGVLRAHDMATGELRWCIEIMTASRSPEASEGLAGTGDGVVLPVGGEIVAYDPSGTERWRTASPVERPWLLGGDVLWAYDGGDTGHVVALDPATGRVLDPVPGAPPRPQLRWYGADTNPTRVGSWEVRAEEDVSTDEYDMEVVVLRDGEELWRDHLPGDHTVIGDSSEGPLVMIEDPTGGTGDLGAFGPWSLTGYAADDGTRLWTTGLDGFHMTVSPLDESTVLVSDLGTMTALDPATGRARWTADLGSPGRGGRYSDPGTFWFVAAGPDGASVGLITAVAPAPPD
jgi:outer membrane protein assembly factor BamB